MKILDITVDLETLALTPNAAILQIAAVAWQRDAEDTPFFLTHWKDEDGSEHSRLAEHYTFDTFIDLRSCVSLGMDFDQETVDWWSRRKPAVKMQVLGGTSASVCFPSALYHIHDALASFLYWAQSLASSLDKEGCSIRLWSQGSDFDIAILRNACHKCELTQSFDKVFPHSSFRDARSFILEIGRTVTAPHFYPLSDDTVLPDIEIYTAIPPFEGENLTHDALYDCQKTTWQVWNVMKAHALHYPKADY